MENYYITKNNNKVELKDVYNTAIDFIDGVNIFESYNTLFSMELYNIKEIHLLNKNISLKFISNIIDQHDLDRLPKLNIFNLYNNKIHLIMSYNLKIKNITIPNFAISKIR